MGKPSAKKKTQIGLKSNEKAKTEDRGSKAFDEDTAMFITLSHDLKEEGKKLFHKHDHEGAMLKYEKALKLLPPNHIDVSYLRSCMASCYMQMGIGEYPRAVNECNLALQVAPKYSKALLRRAKCYEALHKLDLALRDVDTVLSMEPSNSTALEIANSLKKGFEKEGLKIEDKRIALPSDYVEPTYIPQKVVVKEKGKKKKGSKFNRKSVDEPVEKNVDVVVEKKAESKTTIEEKRSVKEEKVVMRSVKLVHEEDIRSAQLPVNCNVRLVRDVVIDRYPSLKGVLIKYKDQDGDLVTITTTNELRVAEGLAEHHGHLRLYIVEVDPDTEPIYEGTDIKETVQEKDGSPCVVENWIVQFARLFKSHVGFESDSYLDLHEIGIKLYLEAMEDSIANESAQQLFDIAAAKFQEMTALALFNWGNVHLSKAKKKPFITEDGSAESMSSTQVKDAYDWVQKEYAKASMRYEESLKIKPDFYEGCLALGLLQFEQAKLTWYYITKGNSELAIGPSAQVLELYNKAEDSMEKGMQIWEEMEEQRLNGISKQENDKTELRKFGLDGLLKDISTDEASEHAANMKSQIYLLWGKMLYERSVVEYKLTLQTWEECLEVAVEKFELAGASQTDIAVIIRNHCSNETALEGFNIDEIVQAWNEMYDADKWRIGVASFRLEPLFRSGTPKLISVLERQ